MSETRWLGRLKKFPRRWLWLCAFFGVIVIQSGEPAKAVNVSPVSLRVAIGFQSYYNPRVWAPIRVAVSNRGRHSLTGEIQYHVASTGGYPYEGTLKWNVTVPAGGTRTLTIGVPGRLLSAGGLLHFDSAGKSLAAARLLGVPSADIAGVVSDYPEAVQLFAGVSESSGAAPLVAPIIAPATLPTSTQLLQSLTYLYLDGGAAGELSAAQATAIVQWVRAGGILILGGMEPNAGQVGIFSEISPVAAKVVQDTSGAQLGNYAGSPAPIGYIPQLFGTASKDATVWIGSAKQALLASRSLGRGEVAYVGLSAASPKLISWSGNALLWDTLLHSLQRFVLPAVPDLFGASGLWSLMSAAELFPQLHTPPLWIWELVFALYLMICGPLLYLLLRRRRKSEWAWLLLPVFSISLAGSIYELGVVQRPNGILTQSVGLVDIIDKHTAQTVGVEALMSPQERSYSVLLPSLSWAVPMAERVTGNADDAQAALTSSSSLMQFNKVQGWGGRFVYAERTASYVGALSGELFRAGLTLGGYLTNRTAFDFSDFALVVDGQVFGVGALPRGDVAKVQITLRSRGNHQPFVNQLGVALTSASHGVGRALFDYARRYAGAASPPGTVILIGWTHEEPKLFFTDGAVLPARPQWIVRQVMPVSTVLE